MKIVIVGVGKVGLFLTETLTEENHDVTVIDNDPRALERVQEACDALAVQGHGAMRAKLLEAEADDARLLVATTGSDEINLLTCLMAKKMGCQHTIARVRNPEYADDLNFLREDLGLSFSINPEEACSREIYQILQYPSFLERDQFAKGRVEIVGFKVKKGSPLIGVRLADLMLRVSNLEVLVCAVERGDEVMVPHGNFIIREGDDLHITAASQTLSSLIKKLNLARHKVTQATIVGGSRMAIYLARQLLASGVSVKIIENSFERCHFLAEALPEADVVEGDGTEQKVLLSEGVERSDALVAITGIDEENLMLGMYAKQLGVPKVVVKSNRLQYRHMFNQMGLESVVSPTVTSADKIVRYVRAMENSSGGKMLTMHAIINGKVEAMEFGADQSAKMLGIPLSKLKLKDELLVASITRGRQIIIPNGSTTIENGDNVVIVSAKHFILDLNDILADE